MSTSTLTVPQLRLAPCTRKAILVAHVISSVAILGQVWVNAVLVMIAIRTPDMARAAYSFMQGLVFASAAPLSVLSLVRSRPLPCQAGWLPVPAASGGEQAKQLAPNLVPHDAGKGPVAPYPAAAGAAATRWGGLMVGQDTAQRVDRSGLLTGLLQLGEPVPHRADQVVVARAVS